MTRQGFRTVRERKIEYQSIGPNADFGQANDPHRDSRHVRIGVNITSPTKCVFQDGRDHRVFKGREQRKLRRCDQ